MTTVSVVGGSGYAGGEVVRLLLQHPEVNVQQVSSRSHLGEYLYQVHPNLRKQTELKFCDPEKITAVDVLFLAMPHGQAQTEIKKYDGLAKKIVDLSADFRLNDGAFYQKWYGSPHAASDWLDKFTYGLPEINRFAIQGADYVSGVGCNATAAILALKPLMDAGLLALDQEPIIEIKTGSSEGGVSMNAGSHHPERAGVIRTFSAFGHRHSAEVIQAYGFESVRLTMTAVDLVRGALATAHVKLKPGTAKKEVWKAYRTAVSENPFLRLVNERRGIYRVPEPKILAGSNYADIGFAMDEETDSLVSICAIDNLMKGAAGSSVQSMNLMMGWDETTGLTFPGLHPL